ncbi:MAG: ATP-grasp domain-containing protein [Flavobacteriaceae bacterium]|nr:ATP-grasp domain-containing protein [Flavobacteriaceae bacterium]
MADSILIFGAGLNQLTLIEAAKELGLRVIVLDVSDNPPGKNLADYFYKVKGDDYESTKEIALKHEVSGIVTSQMEKPMRLMAKLAKDLGFIFHSPAVTEKSLDKWLMKQAFIENNVPCAKGRLFNNNEEIIPKDIVDLMFPVIIKPKYGTSSQGVRKIDKFEDIFKYRTIAESFSRTGEVIIEEYLDGPEYSVETITFKGKTTIVQYTEKFITPFPCTVEMGHLQPALLTGEEKKEIGKIVINAVNAVGIDNSASHTEVKLTKDGPKLVEIGARLGGDYISSYLVLHSCGVNMDKAAIQVALGIEPDLKPTMNQYSYIKYLQLPEGKKIKKIGNWKKIFLEPNVVFADVAVGQGEIIQKITESSKRHGFVIVKENNRELLIIKGHDSEQKIIDNIILEE